VPNTLWAVVVRGKGNYICFDVPGGLCVYERKQTAKDIAKQMWDLDAENRGERRYPNPWRVRKFVAVD
jgi:hypothetical protein